MSDAAPGDGECETVAGNGICTLRAAIEEANNRPNINNNHDLIYFDLEGDYPSIWVKPGTPLPSITESVIIGSQLYGSKKIILRGPTSGDKITGLVLQSPSQIYNLVFQNFSTAIQLAGSGGHTLNYNYVGTDEIGTTVPIFNGMYLKNNRGIYVNSPQNHIQNNVISANTEVGIFLEGSNANNNTIQSNKIGTDKDGNFDLGNYQNGITLSQAPGNNITGNTISGNDQNGMLVDGAGATDNRIVGNKIGINIGGTGPLANGADGIALINAPQNTIGGSNSYEKNIISANLGSGVHLRGAGANNNKILGNFIGTSLGGNLDLGNLGNGILAEENANNTQIGGKLPGEDNVISGNQLSGVSFKSSTSSGEVWGNYIGTDYSGNAAIPNGQNGIEIENSSSNQIGDDETGGGNLISGNQGDGILLRGTTAYSNEIQGNTIGMNIGGTQALANGKDGVHLIRLGSEENGNGPTKNTIGGDSPAARNLISGNSQNGICLEGKGTSSNTITGNFIGTDPMGALAVGNGNVGIRITSSNLPELGAPYNNQIGGIQGVVADGPCSGECNLISGNAKGGVQIDGVEVNGNILEGNFIGTDLSGKNSLSNQGMGVTIAGSHSNVIGGFPENPDAPNPRRNLISGNQAFGLQIIGALAKSNNVLGNFIGTDVSGLAPLANTGGILLKYATGNKIGSTVPKTGNIISANQGDGIVVDEAHNNLIQSNQIGLALDGITPLGNSGNGVLLQNGSTANTIGGDLPEMANHIANNQGDGVFVAALRNIDILGNSIHDNGKLGIDLDPVGVTANDTGDVDLGVNLLQNYPLLSAVSDDGGKIGIRGYLQGLAGGKYRIEFFSNQSCDPSENGEGEMFLGSYLVTADEGGEANFSVFMPHQGGQMITATATDQSKNTSEFSPCRQVGTGFSPDPDLDQILDDVDNCPNIANPDQADTDGDRKGNACDVCPNEFDHSDYNNDGIPDCSQTSIVGGGCSLVRRESTRPSLILMFTIFIGAIFALSLRERDQG